MDTSKQTTTTLTKFPHILEEPSQLPRSVDPFTITASRGFLPLATPTIHLPDVFAPLESLVSRLPVLKEDGTRGLLATYDLGPAVLTLPDLTEEIEKQITEDGKPDKFIISALFRDYSFVASAYLLEPCWETWSKNPAGGYGLGRELLPKAVARPMSRCAQMYVSIDPDRGIHLF
jgi:indoleamine 2,3-dioxygenase